MSRTITAYYDTRADAEKGRERLIAANIDADHVRVHDQSSSDYSADQYSTAEHGKTGMWGSIKNAFLPDEDRATYEEGIRRGGAVLTADVDDDQVDEAVRVLEETTSIDIDDRANSWRQSGWTGPAMGAGALGAAGATGYSSTGASTGYASGTADRDTAGEQVLPVVEERLVVGKREVERGGVRVRTYVTERPVHEQIRLREERVQVERRPVDQRVDQLDGDAFRERTIELTERSEEAVVGKEARVVEEVVVSKTSQERTQEIDDTVRRTDVDVENLTGSDRGAMFDAGTTGTAGSTGVGSTGRGESLGDKARDLVQDAKDGLGMNRNRGAGEY